MHDAVTANGLLSAQDRFVACSLIENAVLCLEFDAKWKLLHIDVAGIWCEGITELCEINIVGRTRII